MTDFEATARAAVALMYTYRLPHSVVSASSKTIIVPLSDII